MELKGLNKLKLLNAELGSSDEFIAKQREDTQSLSNQNDINQLLSPQDLKIKGSVILGKTNNHPNTEQDFRRTCVLFESQKSDSNSQLNEAYQKYIRDYHKITSLYLIHWYYSAKTYLHIFDTEKEETKVIELKVPEQLTNSICLAVLPNGELFFFGDMKHPGLTFILNSDFEVRLLPTGEPCIESSAIYFNKSVYCFGGMNKAFASNSSSKFDLDRNRWVKLAPMPIYDYWCSSVIFNGNILISGLENKNLLLYSIDIDSFSIISYNFTAYTKKLLVKADRLYLIECTENGLIYENEAEDEYAWKQIGASIIKEPSNAYGIYNKEGIYIIAHRYGANYYKFDLNKKEMFNIHSKNNWTLLMNNY